WRTLIATAIGISFFVISLMPWAIGLENQPGDPEAVEALPTLNVAGLAQVPQIFGRIVGAVEFPTSELRWHENPSGLWDTLPLNTIGAGFGIIALVGIGGLAFHWLRAPRANMPQGFIAAMGFAPFGIILLAAPDQPITDHFFIPVTFAAISAAAYLLAQVRLRWPVVLVMLVLIVNYILLTASHLWWLHQHRYEHPNGNLTALSEQAEQFLRYGDVLLMLRERSREPVLPAVESFRTAELHWSWYVMGTRYPIYRADSPGDFLIVPGNQRIAIIGRSFSQLIPVWFGESDLVGYAERYRILTLEPPAPAQEPHQYAGVAKLTGMYHDEALCSGVAGGITLIWQPLMTQP
ncbi:MAG: hypothetical protein L0Z53_23610, partial [Acidobacteriales bacterium]|nr:hypothetical protein [Terriglobales bacterium]